MAAHKYQTNARATRGRRDDRKRLEAGLCRRCGRVPPVAGRTCCAPCYAKKNESSRKHMRKMREAMHEIGICANCLRNEAMPNRRKCGRCSEVDSEAVQVMRRHRQANGLCRCGATPAHGRKQCQACLDRAKELYRIKQSKKPRLNDVCR